MYILQHYKEFVCYSFHCLNKLCSRIYKKIISNNFFKISLQIYIIIVNFFYTYFHFFALKTDNSLFCHRDISTIHNGYCISNAVVYAKKNNVLPTILLTFSQASMLNLHIYVKYCLLI